MYISVAELKRSIVEKKGLSRDHAAELMFSEAQTGRGSRRAARRLPDEETSNPTLSVCAPAPAPPAPSAFAHGAAEWNDDSELIQKNTSIIVRRVPGQKPKTLTAPEPAPPGYAFVVRSRTARQQLTPRGARSAVPEKRERVIAVRPTYASKCVCASLPPAAAQRLTRCAVLAASARGRTGRSRRRKRCPPRPRPRCFTRRVCVLR